MRIVLQRVSHASVTIDNTVKSAIGPGLLLLVGVEDADTDDDIVWTANKIMQMRIFNDDNGVMNRSCLDVGGDVLIISQFTLFASYKKGNRPSYLRAAGHAKAIPTYEAFYHQIATLCKGTVGTGEFGADMKVDLLNDGPVTICIDSKARE